MSNFIDRCLLGIALLEEIDEYVDSWHVGDSEQSLREYLGMTPIEYKIWINDSTVLPLIVKARHGKESIQSLLLAQTKLPLAARSNTSPTTSKLLAWLDQEGFLKE